ncbi:unnamed protein product [Heterobilharzia americana]|nr:unnamed protein product [Heterobilharzia americana]
MLNLASERVLTKLHALPPSANKESSVLAVINEAFTCSSAHVRSGCLDILAVWNSPQACLSAGSAGEVVLWHTNDCDPRVRDRAYHCLLTWLCSLNLAECGRFGKPKYFNSHKESTKLELTEWFESNLECVYAAACQGLLDNEEMVRRTSLHVLGKLSITWPHHSLVDVPVFTLNSLIPSKPYFDSELEHNRLVDDAFSRVCSRIQDPSRCVRQLAAQIMSDLAKFVTEDCLLQTLEKTVMSDRQVRRSMLEQHNVPKTSHSRSTGYSHSQSKNPASDSVNLISSGSNGAIISGLEDDYFEVRCTTLATVTHIASLSTRFALNCQDLLVDMLTDDIQDVRLAAVRALSAVGDKVSVKSEQVSIITSALAEGSGRIRRRLHHLLSQCRLASAPCLISLLDGLLQNLRRYPEDRDNLWRCAASVGRNHPVFVETCLSSLLRTHSWLNGPEPVKEDPAYLTVLLLVLNAEPSVPGMQAKFPRHVSSTKIYLRELLPSLLPKSGMNNEFQDYFPTILPNKKLCLDNNHKLNSSLTGHCSLYKFVASTICRIRQIFANIHDELHCYCLSVRQNKQYQEKIENLRSGIPSYEYQSRRNALLSRLVFNDLWDCAKKLDHVGRLKNLLYWLILISTTGWYLASVVVLTHYNTTSPTSTTATRTAVGNQFIMRGDNFQLTDHKAIKSNTIHKRVVKLISKAIRNSLKIKHLFSGKTKYESLYVSKLYIGTYPLVDALNALLKLLHSTDELDNGISSPPVLTVESSVHFSVNRKRPAPPLPMELDMEQSYGVSYSCDESITNYLMDCSKRLIPVYAMLIQPSGMSSSVSMIDAEDNYHGIGGKPIISLTRYQDELNKNDATAVVMNDYCIGLPTPSFSHRSGENNVIPEIRFTAIIASAMIRIRALIVGLNINVAREHVCIIFRRPDPLISLNSAKTTDDQLASNTHGTHGSLYCWWPPSNSWHLLDEDTSASVNQDHLEIRTHIELSAGRWSDSGTIELGLGYCLQSTDNDEQDGFNQIDDYQSVLQSPFVIPLTPMSLLSKVKLVPCAPINQW